MSPGNLKARQRGFVILIIAGSDPAHAKHGHSIVTVNIPLCPTMDPNGLLLFDTGAGVDTDAIIAETSAGGVDPLPVDGGWSAL
jgi:hypothetical protein